jgi:hypothetical protein
MIWRLGVIVALSACAAPAWSQTVRPADPDPRQATQSSEPTTLDDVVVSGAGVEERATRFVDQVAQPARGRGLARWAQPACVGVVNFDRDAARYIADQMVTKADSLGLPVGEPDCTPNVFVVGAVDASSVAQAWVSRSPLAFRPAFSGASARRSVLDNFVSTDAPVRWWHISVPMNFDIFTGQASPAVRMPGGEPPRIPVYSVSQKASRVRDDLMRVVILVDVEKLGAITTDQLCDYLLMVAYAQIDPTGETATYETILNLFQDPSTQGLTYWDRSYLAALYEADPERRVSGSDQAGHLADEVRRGD